MCDLQVIVERMLNYLGYTTDPHNKAETSTRIAELAERYAPDNQWFIEVLAQGRVSQSSRSA